MMFITLYAEQDLTVRTATLELGLGYNYNQTIRACPDPIKADSFAIGSGAKYAAKYFAAHNQGSEEDRANYSRDVIKLLVKRSVMYAALHDFATGEKLKACTLNTNGANFGRQQEHFHHFLYEIVEDQEFRHSINDVGFLVVSKNVDYSDRLEKIVRSHVKSSFMKFSEDDAAMDGVTCDLRILGIRKEQEKFKDTNGDRNLKLEIVRIVSLSDTQHLTAFYNHFLLRFTSYAANHLPRTNINPKSVLLGEDIQWLTMRFDSAAFTQVARGFQHIAW